MLWFYYKITMTLFPISKCFIKALCYFCYSCFTLWWCFKWLLVLNYRKLSLPRMILSPEYWRRECLCGTLETVIFGVLQRTRLWTFVNASEMPTEMQTLAGHSKLKVRDVKILCQTLSVNFFSAHKLYSFTSLWGQFLPHLIWHTFSIMWNIELWVKDHVFYFLNQIKCL